MSGLRFTARIEENGNLNVYDDDFTLDALLRITGDWPSDAIKLRYGQQVADALNAIPPQIPTREECEPDSPQPSTVKP